MNEQTEQNLISQWVESIEYFVIQDIRKCIEKDFLGTGLIILTLTGIECISGYFCGKEADQKTFCAFLASDHFPSKYASYSEQIYQNLRNGLVHDQAIKRNAFSLFYNSEGAPPHLAKMREKGEIKIMFNREAFAIDFVKAWESYSLKVVSDPISALKVIKRLHDRNRGLLMVKDLYLSNLDTDQQVKYTGGTIGEPHQNLL